MADTYGTTGVTYGFAGATYGSWGTPAEPSPGGGRVRRNLGSSSGPGPKLLPLNDDEEVLIVALI